MIQINRMTTFDFEAGEVLLFDKPYEWSSFDVVNKVRYQIRNYLGKRNIKVGHAGTLDPLASGLLMICTGKATKRIEELQAGEKEYTGTFVIGASTASFDLEKPIDCHYPTDHLTSERVYEVAQSFLGDQLQVPPLFSAIKIDGRRAYKFARQQEEVEIKARPITISEFEITSLALPEVNFRIVCSKGTYIRSIARDFGERLSSGAYMSALRRRRSGAYRIENAMEVQAFVDMIKTLPRPSQNAQL